MHFLHGFAVKVSWIRRLRRRLFQAEPALDLLATLTAAAAIGLLVGTTEVVAKALKYRYDGVFFEWSNPDAMWMIPTAVAGFFMVIAGCMFVVGALPDGRLSLRSLLTVLGTLGAWTVLYSLKRLGLHPAAEVILAVGVGFQLGRTMSAKAAVVRTVGIMGAVAGVAAVAAFVWFNPIDRVRERTRIANIDAPERTTPNVLLIVLDVVRAMNLELHGYDRPTAPHLVRLAERGVVFDRAYATAPWTLPSHASLFTGRSYTEMSSDWLEPLDAQYPTLAEFLTDQGYVTGGFVANLLFTTRSTGLDRGFASYRDHQLDLQTWLSASEVVAKATKWARAMIPGGPLLFTRKYATDVNEEFLQWLDDVGERPFFAFLNYFDAHDPYERFDPYFAALAAQDPRDTMVIGPGQSRAVSDAENDDVDRYDSAIAFMDNAISSLLDSLDARAALDNTLIIVTSDHGELFLEHGLEGHSNSLYHPVIHVPFLAVLPGRIPEGRRIVQPVSIRDVPSTVVDLLGFAERDPFAGRSLQRTWTADTVEVNAILAETNPYPLFPFDGPVARGPMKSLIMGGLHYVRNGDGIEELYDLHVDPGEVNDLAGSERGEQLLPRLRQALRDLRDGGNFRATTWSFLQDSR